MKKSLQAFQLDTWISEEITRSWGKIGIVEVKFNQIKELSYSQIIVLKILNK